MARGHLLWVADDTNSTMRLPLTCVVETSLSLYIWPSSLSTFITFHLWIGCLFEGSSYGTMIAFFWKKPRDGDYHSKSFELFHRSSKRTRDSSSLPHANAIWWKGSGKHNVALPRLGLGEKLSRLMPSLVCAVGVKQKPAKITDHEINHRRLLSLSWVPTWLSPERVKYFLCLANIDTELFS